MKKLLYLFAVLGLLVSSCSEDYFDAESSNQVTKDALDEYANSSPEAVIALTQPLINGMYSTMIEYQGSHDVFGQKSIDLAMDLQGTDIVQLQHHWFGWDYLMDNRSYSYRRVNRAWEFYYKIIFASNEVLKLMPENPTVEQLKSIKGQALGMRAWAYYYLVRIYQFTYDGSQTRYGVPLYRLTGSEYEDGRRAPVQMVYDGIVEDFTNSYELLHGLTPSSKNEINANAVALFLADAYLTMKNYTDAASWANKAREGYSLMTATQYKSGFNDVNLPEVIWGSDITAETTNYYATFPSHICSFNSDGTATDGYGGPFAPKVILSTLYDAIPAGDVRKDLFLPAQAYRNVKFLQIPGFLADVFYARVAEAYLIEAEALARNSRETDAKNVIKLLLDARFPTYTASYYDGLSGENLINEILFQKRIELWGEGRQFFDLKRLKMNVDRMGTNNHRSDGQFVVLSTDKKMVYAMPRAEIEANPNLELDDNQ